MTRVTHITQSAFPALPARRREARATGRAEDKPVEILAPRRPANRGRNAPLAQRRANRPSAPFLAQYVDQHSPRPVSQEEAARKQANAGSAYRSAEELSPYPVSIRLKDL